MAQRMQREMWQQLKLGWPVTFTMILKSAVTVISVIFVGHIGSHQLAAAALATLTANVTGTRAEIGTRYAQVTVKGVMIVNRQQLDRRDVWCAVHAVCASVRRQGLPHAWSLVAARTVDNVLHMHPDHHPLGV